VTYILLKLNASSVEKFSQDSHTETIMLSIFVIFKLRFHYKTIDVETMTIFTKKWDKCVWELNLFDIVKMIEFLWQHCDVWQVWNIYSHLNRSRELAFKRKKMMLQLDLKETSDSEDSQNKHTEKYTHKIIDEWLTLRVWWVTCESVRHQVKSSI